MKYILALLLISNTTYAADIKCGTYRFPQQYEYTPLETELCQLVGDLDDALTEQIEKQVTLGVEIDDLYERIDELINDKRVVNRRQFVKALRKIRKRK